MRSQVRCDTGAGRRTCLRMPDLVHSMIDVGRVLVLLGEGLEHLDIGLVQAGVVHGKEGAEHAPVAKPLGHYTNMQKRGQSDAPKRPVARPQHPPAAAPETSNRSDAKPEGAGVAAGIAWRTDPFAP